MTDQSTSGEEPKRSPSAGPAETVQAAQASAQAYAQASNVPTLTALRAAFQKAMAPQAPTAAYATPGEDSSRGAARDRADQRPGPPAERKEKATSLPAERKEKERENKRGPGKGVDQQQETGGPTRADWDAWKAEKERAATWQSTPESTADVEALSKALEAEARAEGSYGGGSTFKRRLLRSGGTPDSAGAMYRFAPRSPVERRGSSDFFGDSDAESESGRPSADKPGKAAAPPAGVAGGRARRSSAAPSEAPSEAESAVTILSGFGGSAGSDSGPEVVDSLSVGSRPGSEASQRSGLDGSRPGSEASQRSGLDGSRPGSALSDDPSDVRGRRSSMPAPASSSGARGRRSSMPAPASSSMREAAPLPRPPDDGQEENGEEGDE